MRKLLLGLLLLVSTVMFSQSTFVKKYTTFVAKQNGVFQEWKQSEVTVVFNPKGVRDVVFYYENGSVRTFHQIGDVKQGKTNAGDGYQIIECIDQDGYTVALQLFDSDTALRVIVSEGNSIEFHND